MKPVIHWDMSIRCRSRDQAHNIIKRLMKESVDFDCCIERGNMADGKDCWIVSINDMSWGNNIKTVARIVAKEDADP